MAYRPFDLTGKVALVTGGNGGIGFGMVEALAQAGADVVIWGSNGKKNAAAAEALKDSGVRVLTQVVDVADENAVREGMAEAVGWAHTLLGDAAEAERELARLSAVTAQDVQAALRRHVLQTPAVTVTYRQAPPTSTGKATP